MSETSPTDAEVESVLKQVPQSPGPIGPCIDDGRLIAHREGRLPEAEVAAIDRHLSSCADCRALQRELGAPLPEGLEHWARGTLQKKSRRAPALIAGALALAAVLLAVLLPAIQSRSTEHLSGYTLQGPTGGVKDLRSEAPESGVFVSDSELRLIVLPDRTLGAEEIPQLAAWAEQDGGTLVRLPERAITAAAGGGFRLAARAGELFGTQPGKKRLIVVLIADGSAAVPERAASTEELRAQLPEHRWMEQWVDFRGKGEGVEQ